MKNSDRFIVEWKFSTDSCWKCTKKIVIYMMAGFYCTVSPFIKLNSKVVFISLFWFLFPSFGFYFPLFLPSYLIFWQRTHQPYFNYIIGNDLWVSDFFGVDGYWVPDHSSECPHSIILARSSIVLLANTALETLPSRFINTLMLGRPTRLYFDSVSAIMMGETKQFLMVKLSSLSAYYLILVSWWMPVLETSTNLGQMRKMPKEPP